MKDYIIPIILITIGCTFLILFNVIKRPEPKQLSVSLPEEISLAEKGDKLIVIDVSDSIYVGFDNNTTKNNY